MEAENFLDNLPQVCNFYKFFLVEELALEDNYAELHIGKCAVIGKIYLNEKGHFELENVHLPHMSPYSLPEGSVTIRLVDFLDCVGNLQSGRFCEAFGEVVLIKTVVDSEEVSPRSLTTHDLHLRLRHFEFAAAKQQYLKFLKNTHKVAIKLDFFKEIDNAGKLVEYNLVLREFYK